jgi:hypothetical protein
MLGFFVPFVVNYGDLLLTEIILSFMFSVGEPIVIIGETFLQLFYGIIIVLIILPLRKVFLEENMV